MKRILIIEDDVLVTSLYSRRFRKEGFQVDIAHDGLAGKEQVTTLKPDLVILDLMLPNLNGVEVIKYMRAHSALKSIPIVVFSNSFLTDLVREAWKAGATQCLSKVDCAPKQLVEAVTKLLGTATDAPAPVVPPPPVFAAAPPAPPQYPSLVASIAAHPPSDSPLPPLPLPDLPALSLLAPSLPAVTGYPDTIDQAESRSAFLASGPESVSTLRGLLHSLTRSESDMERLSRLQDMGQHVRHFSNKAAIVGLTERARLAAALDALLTELHEKPIQLSPSLLRTLAQAVDFLGMLFQRSSSLAGDRLASASCLVVDDEIISRRAVTHSLDRARLKSVSVGSSSVALQLLGENPFDLVVLDIEMPEMDGFELCAKLRAMPHHGSTPVVFVTSRTDFDSRVKSIRSGGSDLIAKPFLFMELAVKALIHILRYQVDKDEAGKLAGSAG